MAKVKVLVEGFTSADQPDKEERTCPTITLVRDKNLIIVCDPGTLKDQSILINELKKENLTLNDVNVVFLTHSHIDHFRNIGMFPNAKVIEFYGAWHGDIVDDRQDQLTENIKIIETPGHNYTSLTLIVKTDKGNIAICGDVFWKENYPEVDEYADDMNKLRESRQKLLEIADYIVPGHAGMYKVKK
ncbi:MBL fold metallo-hydrolase [Candidatus Woesearchaeota archaeon]|nr:MBL fold metallo-hydrolase [Candidatus Woesearchaeota archaeon]